MCRSCSRDHGFGEGGEPVRSSKVGKKSAFRAMAVVLALMGITVSTAAPSQAGILDGLLDTTTDLLTGTVDAATGLVVGENGLLSGWLYDNTTTTMSHVNDVVG